MSSKMGKNIDDHSDLLDFDLAMSHFLSMFPSAPRSEIEAVLLKHNGDVSLTIDDLLQFSSCPTSSSESNRNTVSENISNLDNKSMNPPENRQQKDDYVDDEKLALLIQNREFLQYLRTDPILMREIYGRRNDFSGRYYYRTGPRERLQLYPLIVSSTCGPHSSTSRHRLPPIVPNGPPVECPAKNTVPDGPLIDYVDSTDAKWTQKIKERLPFNSSKHSASCSTTYRPIDDPEPEIRQLSILSELTPEEQQFSSRLQNLGRNSKSLLHALATKFALSKGSARLSSRPANFSDY